MFEYIVYPPAYALLNWIRGRGFRMGGAKQPIKLLTYAGFAALLSYSLHAQVLQAPVVREYLGHWDPFYVMVALGAALYSLTLLGFVFGWGKFFPHNDKNTANEREFWLAEKLADLTSGVKYSLTTPDKDGLRWKTVAMGWRFVLLFAPKYIFLAWLLSSWFTLLAIPAMFVVGILYRACIALVDRLVSRERAATLRLEVAEPVVGAYLGAIDSIFAV